jgi:hypothetical protein
MEDAKAKARIGGQRRERSEKILRAAALSFARGLEVGRAARDEDEKKPA